MSQSESVRKNRNMKSKTRHREKNEKEEALREIDQVVQGGGKGIEQSRREKIKGDRVGVGIGGEGEEAEVNLNQENKKMDRIEGKEMLRLNVLREKIQ